MALIQILGTALLVILAYMTVLWLVSLLLKDASIVDIFWGLGFVLTNALYFVIGDGFPTRQLLITVLVIIWGLRLSIHILSRNLGKGEDYRYRAFRAKDGRKFWWTSFFRVFLLQGILMWLISTPLLAPHVNLTPARLTLFDALGTLLWAVGFFFEAVGDWQLRHFKRNPQNKGKLLQTGLWRYSRHPNYFGEAAQWWGYFLIALGTPFGFVTIYSPILMTLLLLRVSGVTLLEKTLVQTKPGYEEYLKTTNAFFPWFPRQPKTP